MASSPANSLEWSGDGTKARVWPAPIGPRVPSVVIDLVELAPLTTRPIRVMTRSPELSGSLVPLLIVLGRRFSVLTLFGVTRQQVVTHGKPPHRPLSRTVLHPIRKGARFFSAHAELACGRVLHGRCCLEPRVRAKRRPYARVPAPRVIFPKF